MDIVVFDTADTLASAAAAIVARTLRDRPRPVLGLASGETPRRLYRQLVAEYSAGRLSFASARSFNLDEYLGVDPQNPHSYRAYMQRELFDHVDIDPARTHLPACGPDQDPRDVGPDYEARIAAAGGIDLQVLGIGANGHIGFNEPSSSLASRTRIKTLTRATLAANRQHFDDPTGQPELAITMGIGTILEAREILLLATGAHKAAAIAAAIEGPVSAFCPASALQLHERVSVLLDTAAAAALANRDYYDWVQSQKARLLNTAGRPR